MARHKFSVAEQLKGSLAGVKARKGYARFIKDLAEMDFQKMLGEKGLALFKEMASRPEFVPAVLGAGYGAFIGYVLNPELDNIAFWSLTGALGTTLIIQQSIAAQAAGASMLFGGTLAVAADQARKAVLGTAAEAGKTLTLAEGELERLMQEIGIRQAEPGTTALERRAQNIVDLIRHLKGEKEP